MVMGTYTLYTMHEYKNRESQPWYCIIISTYKYVQGHERIKLLTCHHITLHPEAKQQQESRRRRRWRTVAIFFWSDESADFSSTIQWKEGLTTN